MAEIVAREQYGVMASWRDGVLILEYNSSVSERTGSNGALEIYMP